MQNCLDKTFDVAIVGAGVAGSTVAILLAQAGLSVIVLERKREIETYKPLCTHFIQPFANSIFHAMEVGHLLDSPYSVRTKAAFHVPGGVIDPGDVYGGDDVTAYAHNLERRVLDPALRERVIEAGALLALGFGVTDLEINGAEKRLLGSWDGLKACVSARMIVAADGRQSPMAALTGAKEQLLENDRAAYFCYCTGIPAPESNRSLFVLDANEMSFLYPLVENRTLLSVYVTMERSAEWKAAGDIWHQLRKRFEQQLPSVDFSAAKVDSQIYSYRRYDNQIRPVVFGNIAFLGDAAVSIDPMSGVGCSFAMKSAALFAEAVLSHRSDPKSALAQYAQRHAAFFKSHIDGIVADSRVAKSTDAVEKTYATILKSPLLQRQYLDLTARLISPDVFQKSYLREAVRGTSASRAPVVPA